MISNHEILDALISGNFKSQDFLERLNEFVNQYFDKFHTPQFIAKETGISRRDLSVWNREGLLLDRMDEEENGWKKYSLFECFWMHIVWKLKKFGVSNSLIIDFKNTLFENNLKTFKQNIIEAERKKDFPDKLKNARAYSKLAFDNLDETVMENELKKHGGLFSITLMLSSMFHFSFLLIISENGDITTINIGKHYFESSIENINTIFAQISQQSFIAINLQQITSSFFQNEKLLKDNDFYFGILNKNEQKLITEIRSKKLKQVTVKIKDGAITHIRLAKNDKHNEQQIKQLSRLLKKGDYKKIEITAVDGKISNYYEEEVIKM